MKKIYTGCFILFNALFCFAQDFDFLNQGTFHIRNLGVHLSGNKTVSESYIRAHIPFKAGDVVRSKDLEAGMKQLFETGWVDGLTYACDKVSDESVDVVLNLTICPRVESFYFTGNKNCAK